jgi:hypothetical protein
MLIAHLAACYANLGGVEASREAYDKAVELADREAAFLTELIGRDPENPKWPARLDENRQEREGWPAASAPARSRWPFR